MCKIRLSLMYKLTMFKNDKIGKKHNDVNHFKSNYFVGVIFVDTNSGRVVQKFTKVLILLEIANVLLEFPWFLWYKFRL